MQVHLYDTTLRDGMQGEGMSLSADEKLRVAHALDGVGRAPDRGRVPELEPEGGGALRAARARDLRVRRHRGLRHDAPARRHRRPGPGPAAARRLLRARVHARRQDVGASSREGHEGRSRREPAHDRGVRPVPARSGQARDLRRRALLRRLPRRLGLCAPLPARGRRRRRRERHSLRHERLVASGAGRRGDRAGRGGDRRARRDPHPRRRRLRRGQLAGRRRAGRAAGAGDDERLRRALRQREPRLDPARSPAQDGLRVRARRTGSCG